jgi:hypothetical protein
VPSFSASGFLQRIFGGNMARTISNTLTWIRKIITPATSTAEQKFIELLRPHTALPNQALSALIDALAYYTAAHFAYGKLRVSPRTLTNEIAQGYGLTPRMLIHAFIIAGILLPSPGARGDDDEQGFEYIGWKEGYGYQAKLREQWRERQRRHRLAHGGLKQCHARPERDNPPPTGGRDNRSKAGRDNSQNAPKPPVCGILVQQTPGVTLPPQRGETVKNANTTLHIRNTDLVPPTAGGISTCKAVLGSVLRDKIQVGGLQRPEVVANTGPRARVHGHGLSSTLLPKPTSAILGTDPIKNLSDPLKAVLAGLPKPREEPISMAMRCDPAPYEPPHVAETASTLQRRARELGWRGVKTVVSASGMDNLRERLLEPPSEAVIEEAVRIAKMHQRPPGANYMVGTLCNLVEGSSRPYKPTPPKPAKPYQTVPVPAKPDPAVMAAKLHRVKLEESRRRQVEAENLAKMTRPKPGEDPFAEIRAAVAGGGW